MFVEDCENWRPFNVVRGNNCWACGQRNGYPFRAQPDKKCMNFNPKKKPNQNKKALYISRCCECPHSWVTALMKRSCNIVTGNPYIDRKKIPDWCPLPDVPQQAK